MAAREFVLMTTFPNKELDDESQTLQQANLLNAVIVQRLKWAGRVRSAPGGVAEALRPRETCCPFWREEKTRTYVWTSNFWFFVFLKWNVTFCSPQTPPSPPHSYPPPPWRAVTRGEAGTQKKKSSKMEQSSLRVLYSCRCCGIAVVTGSCLPSRRRNPKDTAAVQLSDERPGCRDAH